MHEFKDAKNLLDEINLAISAYDPVLKEQARDILLKATFGWQDQGKPVHDPERSLLVLQPDPHELASDSRPRALTLGDYAGTWLPRSGADRALLSLYYLKKVLRIKFATGFQIARELRENGMAPANISVAMHANVKLQRAESRVICGKKGTRQSKNEYAITEVGIQYVESRFNLDYDHGRIRPSLIPKSAETGFFEANPEQVMKTV